MCHQEQGVGWFESYFGNFIINEEKYMLIDKSKQK